MRATEKAERKIEMFLSGLAVKGNVAVSSMIRTNSLTDTFLDSRPPQGQRLASVSPWAIPPLSGRVGSGYPPSCFF
jgi:hypothetical protein